MPTGKPRLTEAEAREDEASSEDEEADAASVES